MHILANDSSSNIPGTKNVAWGGPARFSSQLTASLKKTGHRYTGVIVERIQGDEPKISTISNDPYKSFVLLEYPSKIHLAVIQAKKEQNPRVLMAPIIDGYKQVIREKKPDIVFLNGFGHLIWALLIAAHEEGVPIVQKHAGLLHKELDIYSELYTPVAMKILKSMEKDIARYATKQVFLNTYSEAVFQKTIATSPKKQRLVISLPTPFTSQRRTKKPSKIISIGMVARWDRIKNHAAVLALAEEIAKLKLPIEINVVTHIPETKNLLEMKARYRELVHIHEPMSTAKILAFFKRMDLAILPSYFDVSPTVVLEAASQGVGTIISPTVGWVNHYKTTNNSEWIDTFTNPKLLIKKILRLSGKSLTPKLIREFKRNHNPETVFKQYIKLFKSLAK